MKVCDLIEKLKEHDPEMEVRMSVDPEGNGYYPLCVVETAHADPDGDPIHPDDMEEWQDDLSNLTEYVWLWP